MTLSKWLICSQGKIKNTPLWLESETINNYGDAANLLI